MTLLHVTSFVVGSLFRKLLGSRYELDDKVLLCCFFMFVLFLLTIRTIHNSFMVLLTFAT